MLITLSDNDLATWLLGVSASLGALLAVLVTVIVFVRGQAHASERGILGALARTSENSQQLLTDGSVGEFLADDQVVANDFRSVVRSLMMLESIADMPSAAEFNRSTQNLKRAILAGVHGEQATSEALSAFHLKVLRIMAETEDAFRDGERVRNTLHTTRTLGSVVFQVAILLALGLMFALLGFIKTEVRLPDGLNLITAGLFVSWGAWLIYRSTRIIRRILA